VPPILREFRYNRLTRTVAKTDLAELAKLKEVFALIEKHEEYARDIERPPRRARGTTHRRRRAARPSGDDGPPRTPGGGLTPA
jgi:hypothetical protein